MKPKSGGKLQESLLRKIIERGCQKVTTSISKMLHVPVQVSGVVTGFVPISRIPMLVENPEGLVTAACVTFTSELSGHMIFMLTSRSWDTAKSFLKPQVSGREMELSAFAELANIACSCFITNLADVTRVVIQFEPPEVMEDMSSAVLEDALLKFSDVSELLTVEVIFASDRFEMKGFLFFIPSQESVDLITHHYLQARAQ